MPLGNPLQSRASVWWSFLIPALLLPQLGFADPVTFTWDPPTRNVDGTVRSELAGFKIEIGSSSGAYAQIIDVGHVTNSPAIDLAPGRKYYLTVVAYDAAGESVPSNGRRSRVGCCLSPTSPVYHAV
jgi:hypothetical protein